MKLQRHTSKIILCAIATITAATLSIPWTLAHQQAFLEDRGLFNEYRWENYESYAWSIGRNAALAGGLAALAASLLIPDALGYRMRQKALQQALRDRLKSSEPLTVEQIELIGALLDEDTR